jgi:p24 family protein delta-1
VDRAHNISTLYCHSSAHFVALVLPDEEAFGDSDDEIETWYFDQIYAMTQTKQKHNVLPKQFVNGDSMPDVVATRMSSFVQEQHGDESRLHIQISATPSSDPYNFHHEIPTRLFHPTVLNYFGRTTDAKAHIHRTDEHEGNLEGYGLCFFNKDRSHETRVIFDIALISDKPNDNEDGSDGKSKFNKDAHLTPLEISLDESIRAANVVLREMEYMEKREARMRETAESINIRVRWFSYLSVSILLSVTYIQVSYLKRYFHKKKLM